MAEEAEPDTASWVEVKVTALFTAVTASAFLVVFEVARRSKYLSQVFDRRRATCASRCPPPLVRKRILEWLFVSTDPDYVEYAEMEHMKDVVKERKRQQLAVGMREDPRASAFVLSPFSAKRKLGEDIETGHTPTSNSSSDSDEDIEPSSIRKKPRLGNSRIAHPLTPDVYLVGGHRLPKSVAEYAMSGDLSESQIQQYEEKLFEKEQEEEREYFERKSAYDKKGGIFRPRYLGVRPRLNFSLFSHWKKRRGYAPPPEETPDANKSCRTVAASVGASTNPQSIVSRISSGRSLLTSFLSSRESPSSAFVNRHLRSTAVTIKRPLGKGDRELLRCIGLDAYVMIRFLRLGFDCTFYPFLLAGATLVPTYITSDYVSEESDSTTSEGYFQLTINALPPKSHKLWIPWAYAVVFFCYVLRKIWIEWETFIVLRFDFLANGDVGVQHTESKDTSQQKEEGRLQLEQYRNSCMIEYVPDSHQRDKELFEFFDAVFPNQVKRAEILLNAGKLSKLIKKRQGYIEAYENVTAKHYHAKQQYRRKKEEEENGGGVFAYIFCCCCCGGSIEPPEEPIIAVEPRKVCCCRNRKMVRALPHYLSEIKRLNGEIEEEHRRIMVEKQKSEDREESSNLFSIGLKQGLKYVVGAGSDFTCATGFVEFTNLTAKQTAIQCNVTGNNDFMSVSGAPDPRDMVWENSTVEYSTILMKKLQCEALLFTAALFWSVVVTFLTSITNMNRLEEHLPSWMIPEDDSFWYGLIQGYLPVLFLEFFMLLVPIVLRIVALKFIRLKTKSEVDKFVFFWHFIFRVCNLIIIMISGSIFATLKDIRTNPSAVITQLASNIASSSQFFLNNMIFASGTETMWELAQMPKMFLHFITYRIITVEAKSKRALDKMQEADSFEWGDVVPPFIFAFLVGSVYCAMVPIVLGARAIFFYMSAKVYTHQALFVYAQPYEGGGKMMYLMNRTLFVIIYIAITVFSTVLGLRQAPAQAPSFFFIMIAITMFVDWKISQKFVRPSRTLALTNARIIDEQNKKMEERAQRYKKYKAAKLEKQTNEALKLEEGHDGTPERKRISFSDSGDVTKEPVRKGREQLASKSNSSDSSNAHKQKSGNYSGSDWDSAKYDFYAYRQPIMNKSLWETKPRPYR